MCINHQHLIDHNNFNGPFTHFAMRTPPKKQQQQMLESSGCVLQYFNASYTCVRTTYIEYLSSLIFYYWHFNYSYSCACARAVFAGWSRRKGWTRIDDNIQRRSIPNRYHWGTSWSPWTSRWVLLQFFVLLCVLLHHESQWDLINSVF